MNECKTCKYGPDWYSYTLIDDVLIGISSSGCKHPQVESNIPMIESISEKFIFKSQGCCSFHE